jgi:hypothetical protein
MVFSSIETLYVVNPRPVPLIRADHNRRNVHECD